MMKSYMGKWLSSQSGVWAFIFLWKILPSGCMNSSENRTYREFNLTCCHCSIQYIFILSWHPQAFFHVYCLLRTLCPYREVVFSVNLHKPAGVFFVFAQEWLWGHAFTKWTCNQSNHQVPGWDWQWLTGCLSLLESVQQTVICMCK